MPRQCPDGRDDYANIINGNNTCNHISETLDKGVSTVPFDLRLIDKSNPTLGIQMQYNGGDKCNATASYRLIVQINCNPNLSPQAVTYQLDPSSLLTPCEPFVVMNTPYGCPIMNIGPLG